MENKEKLEEAALKYALEKLQRVVIPYKELNANDAKLQAEKMYTEEEVLQILTERCKYFSTTIEPFNKLLLKQYLEWFNQFKKK